MEERNDALASRSALITGAYGFVGRHLARHLASKGWAITGVGHGDWGREEWRRWGILDWHRADVDVESLVTYAGEPDVAFHCAGSGSVGFSVSHPYQDFQRTVASTLSLLEFARLHRPGLKVVMPSSAGVYGAAQIMPIGVDAPLNPVSPYGMHKKIAEDLCLSYARQFGTQLAIVRLFSVYGIGLRKQLLWDACAKITQGAPSFSGTGRETRDWIHVDDACELLQVASGHASAACPIVNGGSGQAVQIRTVVERLATILGNSTEVQFSQRSRPGDPTHYCADISTALDWGWRPRKPWGEGVQAYAEWFAKGAA